MPLFTALNARENALRSVASRRAAEAERKAKLAAITASAEGMPDQFAVSLMCASNETLDLLRKTREPIKRAQLARALKDLREVWHMVTGKAKPGLTRPLPERTPRRELPRLYALPSNGHLPQQ